MILGAGLFQLPAIKKAVSLGYHVITVDHTPDNPGHRFSHTFVNCSTADKEHVLRCAEKLEIDGICTFSSDIAIPTLGYVCDRLGLTGPSVRVADTLSQKHLFRAALMEHGQSCPDFAAGRHLSEVRCVLERGNGPFVAKPVDTSGSRGVVKFWPDQPGAAARAFECARHYSRSGLVCVESFVEGEEVGGDGFLVDGKFEFIAITHKHLDGFVVTGHSLPSSLDSSAEATVTAALEQMCQKVGYLCGPLNFDVIVSPGRATILEMSPRTGGNGLPAVIQRHFGVDLEVLTLERAVDDFFGAPDAETCRPACGSLVFGSPRAGILLSITDPAQLKTRVEEVYELIVSARIGDSVQPFEHNGNSLGYALFESSDYDQTVGRILHSLDIDVQPFSASKP